MSLDPNFVKMLEKQKYKMAGEHSGVKLCHWLKQSLLNNRVCYKQRFYGIESHRCLQMSPAIAWCQQKCLFCWRPFQFDEILPNPQDINWEKPGEVIDKSIQAQRRLLEGYYGLLDRVDKAKLEQAMNPNNAAISLSGEPTLYPHCPGLIKEFRKRDFSTFLVTNGLLPDVVDKCNPTQLYMSLDAPNKEIHDHLNIAMVKDSWDRINQTADLLKKKDRSVIRITSVKGWNMVEPQGYANIINKSEVDFVEVKAYMCVGASRERLSIENMPSHEEVRVFSNEILAHAPEYKLIDEVPESRVVLLSNGKTDPIISCR